MKQSDKIAILEKSLRIFKNKLDEVGTYNAYLLGIITEDDFESELDAECFVYTKNVNMEDYREEIIYLLETLQSPVSSTDVADILEIDEELVEAYLNMLVEEDSL